MTMERMPQDLTESEHQRVLDFFVEACRVGVELKLDNAAMAGILAGYSRQLLEDDRPMQFYVDMPLGTKSGRIA